MLARSTKSLELYCAVAMISVEALPAAPLHPIRLVVTKRASGTGLSLPALRRLKKLECAGACAHEPRYHKSELELCGDSRSIGGEKAGG